MRRCLPWILHGGYIALIALLLLRMPMVGAPNNVDCAWQGLLQHDWNTGARFGVDTVFTYGPLGYWLTLIMFSLEDATTRWFVALVQALVLGAALTSLVLVLPRGWRAAYRVCLLVLAPYMFCSEVFVASAALSMVAYRHLTAPREAARPRADAAAWALFVAATALAVAAGWAKFTHVVQAAGQLAVVVAVLLLARRPGAAAAALLVSIVAAAGIWMLSGQSLGDLPAYLRGSSEIAAGYNEAMAWYGPRREVVAALLLLGANAALAVLVLRRGDEGATAGGGAALRRWGGGASAALLLLLTWKAGFVRHDSGHVPIFFASAVLAPFLLIAASGRVPRRGSGIVAAAAILTALVLDVHVCHRIGIRAHLEVPSLQQFTADLERARVQNSQAHALPRLRELVGDEPVDILGNEQGRLLAGGFRVRHRPVFQAYSAYTPYLQQLNADFFARDGGPRFVMAKVQATDLHLPMTEDSQAWKVLMDSYAPVTAEGGVLLLERQADRPIERRRCIDRGVAFGEWVDVPTDAGGWHELGLDIEYSARGRLLNLLWRAGDLRLDVRTDSGATLSFPIAPPLVRSTFLLDPLLRSTRDFVAAALGDEVTRVRAFRVRPGDGCDAHFGGRVGVRLDVRPPPAHPRSAAELAAARSALDPLEYPSFEFFPYAVEPPGGTQPRPAGDTTDVLAHAPCSMLFAWPGGKRTLEAWYELPDAAYAGGCHSDGVTFRVEAGRHSPRRVLFERHLQPDRNAADRGRQQLVLEIDLPAEESIALTTSGGPNGDVHCDCSCWRGVRLADATQK